jgi:hypothetical protein
MRSCTTSAVIGAAESFQPGRQQPEQANEDEGND